MDAPTFRRTTRHPLVALLALAAELAVAPAHAARDGSLYALSASAELHPSAVKQRGGRFSLITGFASPVGAQGGPGYALTAKLSAQPLGCASDTIFEDDFDG